MPTGDGNSCTGARCREEALEKRREVCNVMRMDIGSRGSSWREKVSMSRW